MKLKHLLMKTLFVAVGLCVGQSVWATPTTIYGRDVTADLENGYTAWSASDVGSGNWGGNATFVESTGIQISGTGNRNTSKSFTITENSLLTIDFSFDTGVNTGDASNYTTYGIGEDIQIWFNQQNQAGKVIINGVESAIANACKKDVNRNNDLWTVHMVIDTSKDKLTAMTLLGRDGATKASYTLTDAVALSHNITTSLTASFHINRAKGDLKTCLKSIRIQEEEQAVTNVAYTINYKLGDNLVKSVSSTGIVDQVISADVAIDGTETGYEGNHYLIAANEAPSMTLVATAASNVLNVPVRAPYTATLTVTRSVGGVDETPVVTNLTETDAKVCSWGYTYPMYVKKDDVYYIADETSSFGETGTFTDGESINKSVSYTKTNPDIKNFLEAETSVGNNPAYSNGADGYVASLNKYSRGTMLGDFEAGSYMVVAKVTGETGRQLNVRTISTSDDPGSNTNTEGSEIVATLNSALGVQSVVFTLSETKRVIINGQTSDDKTIQSLNFDYVYIIKIPATVSKAISSFGWATYCSPYALDLEHATGLTDAFIVTGGEGGVLTKTSVKGGTVPANTGLLLKADEGTAMIPVVASSSTNVSGNLLVGKTEAYDLAAGAGYVLLNGATGFGFYKNNNAFTVGANTAYLPAGFAPDGARIFFSFDDDVTAINETKSQQPTAIGQFFDLQGRKVAQPAKGLYIVNGKKVVIK